MRFRVFLSAAVLCAGLHAQSPHTIHIRLLDGKTGLPVQADNYLVRVDHEETMHNEWVRIGDDGDVTVTLPSDAKEVAIKATYNMSMDTYVNCEIAKESDKERDIWYSISGILADGVIARNECSETHYKAKPGELVFFVRKRTWREHDD